MCPFNTEGPAFYGDEKVSETVIRTKTKGDYKGKIFVPFYANVPNATATLKLVLQNINFTITEQGIQCSSYLSGLSVPLHL